MGLPLRLTACEQTIIDALQDRPGGMTMMDMEELLETVERREILDIIYKLRSLGVIRPKRSTSTHYKVWVLK